MVTYQLSVSWLPLSDGRAGDRRAVHLRSCCSFATSGQLTDKYEKNGSIRFVKNLGGIISLSRAGFQAATSICRCRSCWAARF
jgi:hypothetical protein